MKDIIQGSTDVVLLTLQMSLVSDSGDSGEMSEGQRQLCHNVLYDFFHGRITNPVEAGKTKIAKLKASFMLWIISIPFH